MKVSGVWRYVYRAVDQHALALVEQLEPLSIFEQLLLAKKRLYHVVVKVCI